MKRSNWQLVLALAVCTLLPTMAAQAKDKVPRPFKMQAQTQQVWQVVQVGDELIPVQLLSAEGWGVGTHCGLFYTALSGPPSPEGVEEGFITSANQDQIYWGGLLTDPHQTITGGTGRFDGATGEFTYTILSMEVVGVDPVAGTMTVSLTWTASGTITY